MVLLELTLRRKGTARTETPGWSACRRCLVGLMPQKTAPVTASDGYAVADLGRDSLVGLGLENP